MRTLRTVQTSFTAGELDPRLNARIEVARYYSGASALRNVVVLPQGGVRRRPGTRHLANLPAAAADGVRLVPFAFSASQTFLLAFYNAGFQVFRGADGAHLFTGTWPGTAAIAAELNWAQSADTLLLFHHDLPPHRIQRAGSDTSWTSAAATLENVPTWDFGAVSPSGTITPSATSGAAITLTASASVFTAAMVGWELAGNGGRARITGFTSATQVTATTLHPTGAAFANTTAFSGWTLAEPVISAARGWPECGTFHQGRLWMGGLKARPTTLLASKAGAFFDFALGTGLDGDGMMVSIDSDQLNQVHQLLSHRGLLIFTSGAEHAITVAPPITPTNVAIDEQSRRGIKRFARVDEVDGALLFVQRSGAAVRQFVYDELQQSWQAELLSLLAPHLILDPRDVVIRKSAAQDDADLVFLPDASGAGVTVLTTLRAQEVAAFSRWTIAGVVRAVAALANGQVFLAVDRGGTVRLLMLDETCLTDHAAEFTFGSPTSGLTGLAHLAGQQVVMVLDGYPEGIATVAGDGTLALPRACLTAEVGLGFEVTIRTMPIEPRDPAGALIGRKSRFVKIATRVHESGAFDLRSQVLNARTLGGPPAPPLETVPPPAPQWRSGEYALEGLVGWHPAHVIEISQPIARPQPLTLQALAVTVAVGG